MDLREYQQYAMRTKADYRNVETNDEPIELDQAIQWDHEPEGVPRVASGVPKRVDRIKTLGNAVVPQIPEIIGRMIYEIESKGDA